MTTLQIPSKENIQLAIDNGIEEDYHLVRLYYAWYSGWFYRNRLKMVADLLTGVHVERLLDIGTGSGIFIPQLLKHTDHFTGIDIHKSYNGIYKMLDHEGIDRDRVDLKTGSILDIPAADNSFDAVVCVSVLEHFADPRPALDEIKRVPKPGGVFVAGFPARNALTSALFGALGYQAEEMHPADHETILNGVRAAFNAETVRFFPSAALKMYTVTRGTPQ